MGGKVNYSSDKKSYSKGNIIILQGSNTQELNFLNEGTVEIKRCGENIKGYDSKEIINRSKRIGILTGPSIFGVENLINSGEHHNSFIAMSDCRITRYIVEENNYMQFFKQNPPIALNILLTMKDFAVKIISNLKKYVNYIGEIEKFLDNLNLAYSFLENRRTDDLVKKFSANGGVFPTKIGSSFINEDFSTILEKSYGDPTYNPVQKFGGRTLEFYHNILKTKPDSFIAMMSIQINIFLYIYDDLSNIIKNVSNETEKLVSKIDFKLNHLFYEPDSPFNKIYSIANKLKGNELASKDLTKSIVAKCRNIDQIYKQFIGKEHIDLYPKYDFLMKDTGKEKQGEKVISDGKYKKMLADSAKAIVSFSTLPQDRQEAIIKNAGDFKKINMSDPTGKDSRMIIRRMQQDFIDLYLSIFLKIMKDPGNTSVPVKLFLYFGYFDEKLLNEEQLDFLYNSVNLFTQKQDTEFPIITLYDYLYLIYTGEEIPGLSLNGEEFSRLIKKKSGFEDKSIQDTPEGRISFELNNMIKEGMRITSDMPRAYIPYLNETSFKGSPNSVLTTHKKLEAFIKRIVSVDFSLFFRELTWKIPGKSELIKKEIKPYMILVPNSGIRVQLWQELIGNVRSTRGRLLVPIFFNSDLNKMLILAFAYFRWELNKLIVGASWMDPVEGGFVGAYYDYSQYYNKMPDLSIETKEDIKILFNKIKIDRDRFAHDYNLWVTYEKDGLPKLNKVVRGIFYRHIPLSKDYREKLGELPLFEELNTKFKNIKNRELKSLEARFHKYADATGNLPEDLEAYLEMLKK